MANQPIRVLFRYHGGVPARQASEEEMAQAYEYLRQTCKQWESSGVKLVGTFGAFGEGVGGFAHYIIFEVDDIDMVDKMSNDIYSGGIRKFYEKHSFDIGRTSRFELLWESS